MFILIKSASITEPIIGLILILKCLNWRGKFLRLNHTNQVHNVVLTQFPHLCIAMVRTEKSGLIIALLSSNMVTISEVFAGLRPISYWTVCVLSITLFITSTVWLLCTVNQASMKVYLGIVSCVLVERSCKLNLSGTSKFEVCNGRLTVSPGCVLLLRVFTLALYTREGLRCVSTCWWRLVVALLSCEPVACCLS